MVTYARVTYASELSTTGIGDSYHYLQISAYSLRSKQGLLKNSDTPTTKHSFVDFFGNHSN